MNDLTPITDAIADVQGGPELRRIAVDKVGIKDLRHPARILTRDGRMQHTVGTYAMYVDLPHHRRGTHMSRFIEILNDFDQTLSTLSMRDLLHTIRSTLAAETAYLEIKFPYFVTKQAPVSGVPSLLDYDVTLWGEVTADRYTIRMQVLVPVTSLCPCSKQISDYGAHNQRSHVTVTAALHDEISIEDIIDLVEEQASCQIYGLIKRPDEKYITERAYDNPKFVEDMVRDVATRLHADARIGAYTVAAENFESIHNHSAYAYIQHDAG